MDYSSVKISIFSRNPPSIKTKEECYILYDRGFFGNKVLEFSCYSIELGIFPNRNSIVWEVRGY
jgi:hypothetical protein